MGEPLFVCFKKTAAQMNSVTRSDDSLMTFDIKFAP